jgi:hypothetical protein
MAGDDQKDQRAGREQRKEVRSPPVPAQSGPPILNHGLESPRSNDC